MKITPEDIANDLKSGVTVFLVAIPLCLGISLASGAPIMAGLIAGILGGIVVGMASGSAVSVSGPAAGLVSIMLAALADLGTFNLVCTATFVAGIFQLIFGFLRGGVIAHFVPYSVVKGMLAAVGVILILKQIPHAVGYDKVLEGTLSFKQNDGENTITELSNMMQFLSKGAISISIMSFLMLFVFSRKKVSSMKLFKYVPASLIVIASGAIVNILFGKYAPDMAISGEHLVQLPNLFGDGGFASAFTKPDMAGLATAKVWKHGFIIAIIASIETLLCIEASDKLDPYKRVTPTSRELKAQGLGNFFSGLIGGLPITSVIVRTSVNIENRAKTKYSTVFHGFLLIASLLFGRELINTIPLASLACILIVVGYKLCNEDLIKQMFKKGIDQFLPFATTIIAVVLTDLLIGVLIGLCVSIFLVLRNYYRMQNFHLEDVNNEHNTYKLSFGEYLTFLSKASLERTLNEIPENARVEFDFSGTSMIDHEVREMLQDFGINAKEKGISISVSGNNLKLVI